LRFDGLFEVCLVIERTNKSNGFSCQAKPWHERSAFISPSIAKQTALAPSAEMKTRKGTMPDKATSAANVEATHAVDIFAFIRAEKIPFQYFEERYSLAPAPGGEKVYAALREALTRAKKVAIASVMIGTRQHLAALIPCGPMLVLNTLRWCSSDVAPGARIGGDDLAKIPQPSAYLRSRQRAASSPYTTLRQAWQDRRPRARSRRPMT
jgi:hypothetical protein